MYQSFIGLEIHIQLLTESKVFCGCKNHFGDEPNTNVCPVCMGYPGVLPSLNQQAMLYSYLVGKALNCELNLNTFFERKNYFYPDLPKNYQISQFAEPLGKNGYIDIDVNGKTKRVRIHEIHLEEDAGKMIHAGDMSFCDYNRTGTPLLEIVTEPDMEIGDEAEILLHTLRRMVRYLGVCDGNMDEGSMRCDANVSINLKGKGLGEKVEIKNLNSSRFVRMGLDYEIERQEKAMTDGVAIRQETRLWNENRDQTEVMRTKESANDYRYFPEPDLPPFRPDDAFFARVDELMVELPEARKQRMIEEYGLSNEQAEYIYEEKSRADFFEGAVKDGAEAQAVASWLAADVQKALNQRSISLEESPLSHQRLAELLVLLKKGDIHGKIAKQVLSFIFDEDKDPSVIIEEKGLKPISDTGALEGIIDTVLAAQTKAVEEIMAGQMKAVGFLMGQVMQATKGQATPQVVKDLLNKKLGLE